MLLGPGQVACGACRSAARCAMTYWPATSRCRSGSGSGRRSGRAAATEGA